MEVGRLGLPLSRSRRRLCELTTGTLGVNRERVQRLAVYGGSISYQGGSSVGFVFDISITLSVSRGEITSGTNGEISLDRGDICALPPMGQGDALEPIVINFNPTNVFTTLALARTKLSPVVVRHNRAISRHATSIGDF